MSVEVSEKCFKSLRKYEELIDTLNFIKTVEDDGTEREATDSELIDILVQNWYNVSQTFYEDGFDFSK
jgi:hypothetical protein